MPVRCSRDGKRKDKCYARLRRKRKKMRSRDVERISDRVNVNQKVTCDDVVEIRRGEFKKKRKSKKRAVTDIKNNKEDEDLLKFIMDDDQKEDYFVAADSVDPELLDVETPDNSVFHKLIGHNCFICKRSGHLTKDCSNKKTPNSKVCLRCGGIGHDMSNCANAYDSEDLKMIQCYVCQGFGHLCCMALEIKTSSKTACYNCGKIGHSGDECVKSHRQAMLSVDSPSSCYKCGQEGHFARFCTYNKEYVKSHHQTILSVDSLSSCYKCGKEGHFARFCTNNNKIDQRLGESTPIPKKIKKRHSSELSKSAPLCKFAGFAKKKTQRYGKRIFIMSTLPKMKKKHGWIVDFPDDLPYDRYNPIRCSSRKIRKPLHPKR